MTLPTIYKLDKLHYPLWKLSCSSCFLCCGKTAAFFCYCSCSPKE